MRYHFQSDLFTIVISPAVCHVLIAAFEILYFILFASLQCSTDALAIDTTLVFQAPIFLDFLEREKKYPIVIPRAFKGFLCSRHMSCSICHILKHNFTAKLPCEQRSLISPRELKVAREYMGDFCLLGTARYNSVFSRRFDFNVLALLRSFEQHIYGFDQQG